MFKTYYPKPEDLESQWLLVDADGQTLGRLASRISAMLLGKGKPTVTPGVDTGDFVIVVNASKIHVTGDRLDQKMYYRHSGYPGGLRVIPLREQLKRAPEKVIRSAVWGMLPHNRYGRRLLKKMRVYSGPDHPHRPQKPVRIETSE
ncbi:MAG: 50S ribosomal protein L13 [Nitrospirae bacterium]|nr:50S ribosomal protein L13 [Nitrospirota bacterium]